jgi:DNA-binding response OmpR family regulator
VASGTIDLGSVTVDLVGRRVCRPDGTLRLGDREAAVVAYLWQRRGAVVTREQLLVDVFGRAPVLRCPTTG